MSDNRPPEGARFKNQDWTPFSEAEPQQEPPSSPPSATPKIPKMGVEVPIAPADFRAHWKELAHYACIDREDVDALASTNAEFLATEFRYRLIITAEQQNELDETGWCTATLPQIEELTDLWHEQRDKLRALDNQADAERTESWRDLRAELIHLELTLFKDHFFSIDYIEWEELHEKGLVSPHKLSRRQLQALLGIKVFDDAWDAMTPPALRVPLSLEDIQAHWDALGPLCLANKHTPAKLFDDIEIIDKEKGTRHHWLTAQQRAEIETRGFTYLDIHQVEHKDAAGYRTAIPVDTWLAFREQGLVSEHHLSEEDVRSLLSVPFFKELFDLKFNKALIAERERRQAQMETDQYEKEKQERADEKEKQERADEKEKQERANKRTLVGFIRGLLGR